MGMKEWVRRGNRGVDGSRSSPLAESFYDLREERVSGQKVNLSEPEPHLRFT